MAYDALPTVRVATEYRCNPLWLTHLDGSTENPSPGELDLPQDLGADLMAWQRDWDAIYPPDDPASADFTSPQAEIDFFDRGLELARRTARALAGRYRITFIDRRESEDTVVPED